jgi:hypothetical protein
MRSNADDLVTYWRARCRVEMDGDCIIWAGALFASNSRPQATFKGRKVLPQREIYRAVHGSDSLPAGALLYMTCRNPLCMAVDHMRPMTHAAFFKRLSRDGELHRGATFSAKGRRAALKRAACRLRSIEDARAIRDAVSAGHDKDDIAQRFGITRDYVNKIVAHRSWREVSPWAI